VSIQSSGSSRDLVNKLTAPGPQIPDVSAPARPG
jgi:hypothetical protein